MTDIRTRDTLSNAIKNISYTHSEIHAGNSYRISVGNTSLAAGLTSSIAFLTPPSGPLLHVVPIFQASGLATFEILEAPTITVDSGTIVNAIQRYRGHANTSQIISLETIPQQSKANNTSTITVVGTILLREYFGGIAPKTPGSSRDVSEWILAPNTIYAFLITSGAAGNVVNLDLIWYEHENVSL